MSIWIDPPPVKISDEFRDAVGGQFFIAETLARRGITTPQAARSFLDPSLYVPAPATALTGIETAAQRLLDAVKNNEPICVWGDFDVDGQTATTVLVSVLQDLGGQVSYYIPVRAKESHGVHVTSLQRILDAGVRVVLTCDTGIAAHEAAEYARSRKIDFIITDHHELPSQLPAAYSIINPRLLPSSHPLGSLPGVGVAFKLAENLYEMNKSPEKAESLLDLVALGIVADVAALTGDTRYLLQKGLSVIRKTERAGLHSLIEVAELNPANITAEHIGYILGPRLNSIGRLGDANSVVELLTTRDQKRAHILALELEGLNAQRQLLTSQVYQAALAQINRDPSLLEFSVLVLAHHDWPAGILGIVASRLVEQYQKPVIMITAEKTGPGRGSARSIPGVNITQAIGEVASHTDFIAGYGGHAMAAGLSIQAGMIPDFRAAISRSVITLFGEQGHEEKLTIDAFVKLDEIDMELIAEIERLAPFGPGNPPIVLAANQVSIQNHRKIGRTQEHLLLSVQDETGTSQKVIWWQGADQQLPNGVFDLAFTLNSSDYRGQPEIQVQWLDARIMTNPEIELQSHPHAISFQDYRTDPFPMGILDQWKSAASVIIWCEDESKDQVGGKNRLELAPAKTLIVWSIPPGRSELKAAVSQVQPESVILLGVNPDMDNPEKFLQRLAGLAKYTLNHRRGLASLDRLASVTAQRSITVLTGLEWLSAAGKISHRQLDKDTVLISAEINPNPGELPFIETRLRTVLQETAAYRAYYLRALPEQLL